jgi:hypothetical protein
VSSDGKNVEITIPAIGDTTELRVTGIDYEHDDGKGTKALFRWSDVSYNPISENGFRRGLAKKKGQKRAQLRAVYNKDITGKDMKGQIPIADHQIGV